MKSELRGCLEEFGDAEAEVIFSIPDGVQLFTIDVSLHLLLRNWNLLDPHFYRVGHFVFIMYSTDHLVDSSVRIVRIYHPRI